MGFLFLSPNAFSHSLFLSESQATDEVAQRLLKEFWSHTKVRQTDLFYDTVEYKNQNTIYAYALVKSRQHDVKKALDAIDALQKMDATKPQPWRLKTWLLLRQDKFNGAVVSLGKYIDAVKADKTLDDFSRAEAYRFAGRVFAFLDGPVKSKTNKVSVDTLRRKVMFKLDPDLSNALTFDYNQVEMQYQKLMGDKQKHDDNFAKQDEKERRIKFAQLSQVEDQLSKSKTKLNEQSGTVAETANKELNAIRQQDVPLAQRQADLEIELADINQELIWLVNDLNYWNNQALRERDPLNRSFFFRRAGSVDGAIIRLELVARRIRNERDLIVSERAALRRQFAATNAIASNQLASIDSELKDITRQQRVTSNQKIRTTKPTRKIITHSVSLKNKATSIVTYEQFPLEIERQLLLDKLK